MIVNIIVTGYSNNILINCIKIEFLKLLVETIFGVELQINRIT